MKVLGIESSCDDTGIALIEDGHIIFNEILKQEHRKGVIPEYAAQAHHVALYENARKIIADHAIDLIAYTVGPGLIGSLFVGSSFAKGLAYSMNVDSIGINHLEAHIILPFWLARAVPIEFPYLSLLISGGHTLVVLVKELGGYEILSTTLDDAVGETFDKIARKLDLDYPGGPNIEKLALEAKCVYNFQFPRVMANNNDFSFSGLKTASFKQISEDMCLEAKADFCNQFQRHIAKILGEKMERMHKNAKEQFPMLLKHWVISGGVAANKVIRQYFDVLAAKNEVQVFYPPIEICTDNGVMIACLGELLYAKNGPSSLSVKPEAQMRLC